MLQDGEAEDALDAGAGQITLQSETVWLLAQLLAEPEDWCQMRSTFCRYSACCCSEVEVYLVCHYRHLHRLRALEAGLVMWAQVLLWVWWEAAIQDRRVQ